MLKPPFLKGWHKEVGENWVYLRSWEWSLQDGISAPRRGGDWSSFSPSPEDIAEWPSADQEDGLCQNLTKLAPCSWTSSLRTVRNKFLLSKPPHPWICIITARTDWDFPVYLVQYFLLGFWSRRLFTAPTLPTRLVLGCEVIFQNQIRQHPCLVFWELLSNYKFLFLGFLLSHLPVCRGRICQVFLLPTEPSFSILQKLLWLGPLALSHFWVFLL